MMKRFKHSVLNSLLIINIIYVLLSLGVYRRTQERMPFIKLEIGALMIALILGLAYSIYKSEKGHPILNSIIAYVLVLPSLFIIRRSFGNLIFRSISYLYIIFVIFGIIYSIALFIASKKYKKEVDNLNQLLNKNNDKLEETSE